MAAPTLFGETGIASTTTGSTIGCAFDSASGGPGNSIGDILVVSMAYWGPNSTAVLTSAPAAPAGWTLLTSSVININDGVIAYYWRRTTANDETGPTFSRPSGWDTGTDTCWATHGYVIRGCTPNGDPWDAFALSSLYASANQAVPAVTVSGAERTVLQFLVKTDDFATAPTVSGWTAGTQVETTTGTDASFGSFRKENVSSNTSADASTVSAPAAGFYAFLGVSFKPNVILLQPTPVIIPVGVPVPRMSLGSGVFAVASTANTAASDTVTLRIPDCVVAGDDLYLAVRYDNGFSAVGVPTDDDTGGNAWGEKSAQSHTRLYWKKATSGTAGKTITITRSDPDAISALAVVLKVFGGAASGDPMTNMQLVSDSFTPTVAGSMIVGVLTGGTNGSIVSSWSSANLGALSVAQTFIDGSSDAQAAIGHVKQEGGPSATGAFSWTWSGSTDTEVDIYFAVKPAETGITLSPAPVAIDVNPTAPTLGLGALALSPAPVATSATVAAPTLGLSLALSPSAVGFGSAITESTVTAEGSVTTFSPAPIALSVSPATPALELGAVTLAPAPVAASLVEVDPALGLALTLAPAPVSASTIVAVPDLATGAVTLQPTPVAVALAEAQPSLSLSLGLTPTPVAFSSAVPSPAIGLGAISLSPAPLALAAGPSAQGLSLSLTLAPAAIQVGTAQPHASLGLSLSLSPSPILFLPTITQVGLPLSLTLSPQAISYTVEAPTSSLELSLHLAPTPVAIGAMVASPVLGLTLSLIPGAVAFSTAIPEGTVAIVGGTITVSPLPIPISLMVPTPSIALGALALSPAPISASAGVVAPSLGLQLVLSPAAIQAAMGVTAPQVATGALELGPQPIVMQLVLPDVGQVGPLVIVSGSDHDTIKEAIAFYAVYDVADEATRRALLRKWLLEHGGVLRRDSDGFKYIRGGLLPTRY